MREDFWWYHSLPEFWTVETEKGERGTAHGHYCPHSKCQCDVTSCFKLPLPRPSSQDGLYPWTVGQKKPVSVQLLPRESSIMAVGKETDRINGR